MQRSQLVAAVSFAYLPALQRRQEPPSSGRKPSLLYDPGRQRSRVGEDVGTRDGSAVVGIWVGRGVGAGEGTGVVG